MADTGMRLPILITAVQLVSLAGVLLLAGQWKGAFENRVAVLEEAVADLKSANRETREFQHSAAKSLAEIQTTLADMKVIIRDDHETLKGLQMGESP